MILVIISMWRDYRSFTFSYLYLSTFYNCLHENLEKGRLKLLQCISQKNGVALGYHSSKHMKKKYFIVSSSPPISAPIYPTNSFHYFSSYTTSSQSHLRVASLAHYHVHWLSNRNSSSETFLKPSSFSMSQFRSSFPFAWVLVTASCRFLRSSLTLFQIIFSLLLLLFLKFSKT